MFWVTPVVVYAALACATVKPAYQGPVPKPTAGQPHPTPQPVVPDWMFICKILNEQGVQKHPSLNPG